MVSAACATHVCPCSLIRCPAILLARRQAVTEHNPKIVFLTSPNNPDGSMMSEEEVREASVLRALATHTATTIRTKGWCRAGPAALAAGTCM